MSRAMATSENISSEGPVVALDPTFAQNLYDLVLRAVDLSLKGSPGQQIELEFRLGRIKSLNRRAREWNFDSSIDRADFFRLKDSLDKSSFGSSVQHSFSVVISKSLEDGSRLRKIENASSTGSPSSVIYQRKTAMGNADQLFLSIPISDPAILQAVHAGFEDSTHMLRFALSGEEEFTGREKSSKLSFLKTQFEKASAAEKARRRERWSYSFDKVGKIELTIVDDKEYSIEFEFNPSELSNWKNIQDRKILFSQHLLRPLKYISRLIWPDLNMLAGISGVTESYFRLIDISTGGAALTDLQPQNIAENEVQNIVSDYSFTNKLNGTRYRLLIDRFKYSTTWHVAIWLISTTNLQFIGILPNELSQLLGFSPNLAQEGKPHGSLIDVELFIPTVSETIGQIKIDGKSEKIVRRELHAMDSPVLRGVNKSPLPHSSRLEVWKTDIDGGIGTLLSRFLYSLGYSFEIKHFFNSPNPLASLQDSVRFMYTRYGLNSEKDNDGIIMQPTRKGYYDRSSPIYKWKWPHTVTIDFQLEETEGFVRDDVTYRVFRLFLLDRNKLTLFGPFNRGGKFYNPPSVIIFPEKDPHLDSIHNGLIAELGFDRPTNSFILFRNRDDKTEPNQQNTGQATFVDMYVEFGLDRLSSLLRKAMESKGKGKMIANSQSSIPQTRQPIIPAQTSVTKEPTPCLENYRVYHNRVKTGLIQDYCAGKRVLDIGSGLGGDLWKFYHAKTSHLWAVEPNRKFIEGPEGFKERLQKVAAQKGGKDWARNVETINSGVEETKQITEVMMASKKDKLVPNDLAEVVSAFFSLSFLFQSRDKLEALARTVAECLEIDGVFVGIMIDGSRLYDALQPGNVNDPCYNIIRKYDPNMPLELGLQVGIRLNTATVLDEQQEWISPFEMLSQVLKVYNIQLVESHYLDDINIIRKFKRPDPKFPETEELYSQLNKSEKRLNEFYRYFVFRKARPDVVEQVVSELAVEKRRNEMKMLSMDESESFDIENYSEQLIRVGVIGEGSCFFHSLLFLMINEKYLEMKIRERKSLAKQFRNALSDILSPEILSHLAGGSVEVIGYIQHVHDALKEALITNVRKEKEEPGITETQLESIINRASISASITEQIEALKNGLAEFGYDRDISTEIIQHGKLLFWEDYKSKLKNCRSYADHDSIEFVMRTIKRNIFIIDDEHRLPILFAACDLYDPKLPSLVVVLLQNIQHYEPVCAAETDKDGNVVKTIFSWEWDSPLIRTFYRDLCQKQAKK